MVLTFTGIKSTTLWGILCACKCNYNIHGPILTFSGDFIYMCRQLNMEDMAEEIMDQLGLQLQSKITFQDFLRFRGQVTKLSSGHTT